MITSLSGLAAFMAIAIGLAPAASAINVPPPGISGATVAPPPPSQVTTVPAHFPLWAIVTIIAATVVLSVATTLITLSLARLRRVRRAPAPAAEPASAPTPTATPEPEAAQDEALTGRPYAARQDKHQAGS
jgi:beta-lactamase regulating signal transducer with metallopeptidase domain